MHAIQEQTFPAELATLLLWDFTGRQITASSSSAQSMCSNQSQFVPTTTFRVEHMGTLDAATGRSWSRLNAMDLQMHHDGSVPE
jgi:hypothetical protein